MVVAVVLRRSPRWVTWPLRAMPATVEQLGPTSLGLRLRATGPHGRDARLADAIDAMLDRVAEGYEAQRRFAANASHELRTPLATQRALIEVSLASALTPEQLELLSAAAAGDQRAQREAGRRPAHARRDRARPADADTPQRLDLIARDAVEALRPLGQGARASSSRSRLAPVDVAGELPLLERLCTQPRPERDQVQRARRVRCTCSVAHATACCRRRTPARPCPPTGPALFEPFRRLSGERLDHGGGVGLGLTIARSIVAAHGGRSRRQREPDGGLTVEARLRPC